MSDRYRKMEEGKENDSNRWASHDRVAVARSLDDTIGRHLESILKIVAAQRIRAAKFRVVLDSNHGAGSVLGRPLLEALGCDVEVLGGTPDGRFDHPPEPLAANLASVSPAIPQLGAAVGFCQDPDADRLAVIDENGCYLGEEYTLALCVDRVLRHTPGPVVANCSTSRMTEDLAKRYGAPFYRTAVGEVNVADAMLREGAVVGGEGSGGVIDPRVGLVRDSFVGMALILDAMAERGLPIGALAAELPRYEMHRAKASLPREMIASGLDSLQRRFHDAVPDRRDGLRLDWADRWLIVRPSNTEPIVRIVAEAPDADQAKALCDAAAATLGVAR